MQVDSSEKYKVISPSFFTKSLIIRKDRKSSIWDVVLLLLPLVVFFMVYFKSLVSNILFSYKFKKRWDIVWCKWSWLKLYPFIVHKFKASSTLTWLEGGIRDFIVEYCNKQFECGDWILVKCRDQIRSFCLLLSASFSSKIKK